MAGSSPDSGEGLSRRAVLALVPAFCSLPTMAAPSASQVRSFHVAIPQTVIDGILARVRQAHWPDRREGSAWQYGVDWNYMKELAEYWTSRFDWRKSEARLN